MTLENKFGLTSSADLAREEEFVSKKKAVELFENSVLDSLPAGKFSTLQAIHKYLLRIFTILQVNLEPSILQKVIFVLHLYCTCRRHLKALTRCRRRALTRL